MYMYGGGGGYKMLVMYELCTSLQLFLLIELLTCGYKRPPEKVYTAGDSDDETVALTLLSIATNIE